MNGALETRDRAPDPPRRRANAPASRQERPAQQAAFLIVVFFAKFG